MITNELTISIVQTSQTISITFLGVGFAIFTLVYAFVHNKKEIKKELEELMKMEGISMTIARRINSADRFINKMHIVNIDAIVLMLLSFVGLLASIIVGMVGYYDIYILVAFGSLLLVLCFFFIRMSVRLIRSYLNV